MYCNRQLLHRNPQHLQSGMLLGSMSSPSIISIILTFLSATSQNRRYFSCNQQPALGMLSNIFQFHIRLMQRRSNLIPSCENGIGLIIMSPLMKASVILLHLQKFLLLRLPTKSVYPVSSFSNSEANSTAQVSLSPNLYFIVSLFKSFPIYNMLMIWVYKRKIQAEPELSNMCHQIIKRTCDYDICIAINH